MVFLHPSHISAILSDWLDEKSLLETLGLMPTPEVQPALSALLSQTSTPLRQPGNILLLEGKREESLLSWYQKDPISLGHQLPGTPELKLSATVSLSGSRDFINNVYFENKKLS